MDDLVRDFAAQAGIEPDALEARWRGRPDRILEDLFLVPDEDGDLHPLRLFPYQKKIVHAYFFGDASTLTILKGRRIGGSFIIVLCLLLEGLMKPGLFYPIVSTKEEQAFSRINDIETLIENAALEIPLEGNPTRSRITLWNNTTFKAYTGAPKGARGDGARSVFIDEMAHVEDQDAMLRAFRPMLALSSGKLVEVTTPLAQNDRFMQTFERGTETGRDENGESLGVISIFQPTFNNADEIDIEVPLTQQALSPARPDLNISVVEDDRAEDPMGFAQEYLCRPVTEQYRFFNKGSVRRAMDRGTRPGYVYGEAVTAQHPDSLMVMAVDVGIDHDETVAAVFEHHGERRSLRYLEVLSNDVLRQAGVENADRGNANHIAVRLGQLYYQLGVDYLIIDKTGAGQTFPRILEEHIGRGVIGFNFSDRKAVRAMFGDMNAGLRNDRVTLVSDDELYDQLTSIVREQTNEHMTPKFSGKDHSRSGKDDMAVAVVMGAYPPGFESGPVTEAVERPDAYGTPVELREEVPGTPATTDHPHQQPQHEHEHDDYRPTTGVYATGRISRSGSPSYRSRYGRRRL